MKSLQFHRETVLPVSAEDAFEWHLREGAFVRLMPPWAPVHPVEMPRRLADGCVARFDVPVGPFRLRWVARHVVDPSSLMFQDISESGPFPYWEHTHSLQPIDARQGRLCDQIEFRPPLGPIGRLLMGSMVQRQLDAMFSYRHRVTIDDLRDHVDYRDRPRLTIGMTGSSGMIGSALRAFLTTGGHRVIRLVRRPATQDDEICWNCPEADPQHGLLQDRLSGCDAVIHLAGAGIADRRWTPARKRLIHESRRQSTKDLVERLLRLERPPRTLISASAIGFYGDRGDEELSESDSSGDGFLAEVCRDWEDMTAPAASGGIRVVNIRLGVVLSASGGALGEMLRPFQLGAGGPVGSGNQWWSWIALDDVIGGIHHALQSADLHGPVNLTAPHAVTNREFAKILGRVLRRPSFLPLPAPAARLILGEMAEELLLASARVVPRGLMETGYRFRFDSLEGALRHGLGRVSKAV